MRIAPFVSQLMDIQEDWIDYNGHLNMAYYNVLFDQGVDEIWSRFGLGPDYRDTSGCTTFSAEFHVRYLRELHLGDQVRVSFQLLDMDEKRLHFYQEIHHADGWLSATGEGMALHIDQSGPHVAAMPPAILAKIAELHQTHSQLPVPEAVGRPMGIRRKTDNAQ